MRILSCCNHLRHNASGSNSPFRQAFGGFLFLILFSLTACSTVHAPPQHVVLVDHSGKSLNPDGQFAQKPQSEEDFDRHLAAITNAIATCTNCVTSDGTKRIL